MFKETRYKSESCQLATQLLLKMGVNKKLPCFIVAAYIPVIILKVVCAYYLLLFLV